MSSASIARRIVRTARERFGWEDLRAGQSECVEAAVGGRDVLAVMPTGYGKSAVYQLAGVLRAGPTVVVSPLIALQADQRAGLEERLGSGSAVVINSTQSETVCAAAWEALAAGSAEFVFLAPEQLARDEVVDRLRALEVGLFVVDEAHCVSSWGHDFRPDYLTLGTVVEQLGRPPVVALTATGSGPVREEVVDRLGLTQPLVLVRGFDRPNLRLEVTRYEDDSDKTSAVIEQVVALPAPGIVYVATRKDSERYAEQYAERGLRAAAYHGTLPAKERRRVHEAFREDELDVVVATSAFGMGIDKPNVRFVVHEAVPESVDSYYQEIGRAGRDGLDATTTLHYRQEDLGLRVFYTSRAPKPAALGAVYDVLREADAALKVAAIARASGLSARRVTAVANLLEEAGVVSSGPRGLVTRRHIPVDEAVRLGQEAAALRERVEQSRLEMMRTLAETRGCRRQALLAYFGEDLPDPCGNCDTCEAGTAHRETDAVDPASAPFPPDSPVRHREFGDGTVMSVEDDRLTVFFDSVGYKVLALETVTDYALLERV